MTDNDTPISTPSDAAAALQAIAAEAEKAAPAEDGDGSESLLDKVTGLLPEGAMGKAASLLDRDGDGNPLNDIAGIAGKFLGR
jgi:hypothetical protein